VAEVTRRTAIPTRTIERAVRLGLVRAARRSPRRTWIASDEAGYLARRWKVLAALRDALRTEPRVEVAAIYGSFARGEDSPGSDIDVAAWVPETWGLGELGRLEWKLSAAAGRPVDVVPWMNVVGSSIFARALLRDGRPLVDRRGHWEGLVRRKQSIRRRAAAEELKRESITRAVVASVAG